MTATVVDFPVHRARPPRAYLLQSVVIITDSGFGISPRYFVEFCDSDGGWSSREWEGATGEEALAQALTLYRSRLDDRHGVRIEFHGREFYRDAGEGAP